MMILILCSSDPPSPMVHACAGVRNADPANDSAAATRQAPYSRVDAPQLRRTTASHASSSDDLSPRRAIQASGFHQSHATTAQSSHRTRSSRRLTWASSCIRISRRLGASASADSAAGSTMMGPPRPPQTNGTAFERAVSTVNLRRTPSSAATELATPRIPGPAGSQWTSSPRRKRATRTAETPTMSIVPTSHGAPTRSHGSTASEAPGATSLPDAVG
jgi:hypothetical protein